MDNSQTPPPMTGIPRIDQEHGMLWSLITKMREAEKNASRGERAALVRTLMQFAGAHFAEEEAAMVASGFSEYEQHRREHETLLSHLRDVIVRYDSGDPLATCSIAATLHTWIHEHLHTSDLRYLNSMRTATAE